MIDFIECLHELLIPPAVVWIFFTMKETLFDI